MKNLDWFQARSVARSGKAVRREQWRKWLTVESYVWLITQPAWDTQLADRRVAQQWDFGADEFLAHDWTDETWPDGPQPPDPPDPPNPPDPPRPPQPPLPPGDGGGGGGGGDPRPPNPPDPPNPPKPPNPPGSGGGGGSGGNGGGGGWGTGGGGGGGPQPPVPPKPPGPHNPPNPDVPTVTVEVSTDIDPDGPSCFIQPPQTCTVYVTVSIAGGPAGVGTLSVSGSGTPSPQLGTGWPGMSQGFEFKDVPVNPGGTVTYTADYGAPGNAPLTHYNGSGSYTFPPNCLIVTLTWTGDSTEVKRCNHGPQTYGGPATDGFDFTANYSVTADYALNPEPGTGKTGSDTGVKHADSSGNNAHGHYTPYPSGATTDSDWFIAPPGSITADVGADHTLTNIAPTTLSVFGPDDHDSTSPCTFDRTSHESGPS